MPRIQWTALPPAFRDHLFDRLRDRKIMERVLLERMAAAPPSELAPLILRLAEIGCPANVVPRIAGHVWLHDERIALAAADALTTLLKRAWTRELLEIDGVRAQSPYLAGHVAGRWHRVSPRELTWLRRYGDSFVWLVGYASFQPSGYVREEAVRLLSRIDTGDELRFLLIRLNDWVAPVRLAAERAVLERLRPANARAFADSSGLLQRLPGWSRASLQVAELAASMFAGPEPQALLEEELFSPDPEVRRGAGRILSSIESVNWPELLVRSPRFPDVGVRQWLARIGASRASQASMPGLLVLARDPVASVRTVALEGLVTLAARETPELLTAALVDRSPAIRDLARFHFGRVGKRHLAPLSVPALADIPGVLQRTTSAARPAASRTGS